MVIKPKFGEDSKKYYIHMIKEVSNYNQLTKHYSDVILSHLIRTKHWLLMEYINLKIIIILICAYEENQIFINITDRKTFISKTKKISTKNK